MKISIRTDRPDDATGVRWTEGRWTECFATIDDTFYGYGDPAEGEWVTDPSVTGGDDCTCDSHAQRRHEDMSSPADGER